MEAGPRAIKVIVPVYDVIGLVVDRNIMTATVILARTVDLPAHIVFPAARNPYQEVVMLLGIGRYGERRADDRAFFRSEIERMRGQYHQTGVGAGGNRRVGLIDKILVGDGEPELRRGARTQLAGHRSVGN